MSRSRDSSCASDELSIASAVTMITAVTDIFPESPAPKILVPRAPKPILKQPRTEIGEDSTTSESSHESDYSDSEFEEPLDFSSSPCQEFEEEFSGKLSTFKLAEKT
jgi:hypothetical protein